MKKIVWSLLFLVILLTVFGSCQAVETTTNATTERTEMMPPPDYSTYRFSTYNELQNAFFGQNGQRYCQEIVSERPEMAQMIACLTQNESIPIPKLNGEPISLRQKDGFNDITIFSSETHQKPWIWYHCLYKGNYFRVQFTYVSLFDVENVEDETDVAKLIKAINPDFPNADNYQDTDAYDMITNGKITIGNERIPCVFYEIKDYSLNRISFIYHGLYVMIAADFTELDSEFFANFSID